MSMNYNHLALISIFWDVPMTNVKNVLKAFILECMNKDKGIIFHPSNNQKAPPPIPFSTEETAPTTAHRVKEFFNMVMARNGMTIYYKIKPSITVMQLKHRVYQFLTANNVWLNNKQIQKNWVVDAAIVFQGHNKYDKTHALYSKIMKALNHLELDDDVTTEQQQVLTELRRQDNFGWTIKNKRHSYTNGQPNNDRWFTDGLIIVVKKQYIQLAREIFAMIRVCYPNV